MDVNEIVRALYNRIKDDTCATLYYGNAPRPSRNPDADADAKDLFPYIVFSPVDDVPRHLQSELPLSFSTWDFKIWAESATEVGEIYAELLDIFNEIVDVTKITTYVIGKPIPEITTTDDMNISAGEIFDVDIVFFDRLVTEDNPDRVEVPVTDFTAGDITVIGAARGSLTGSGAVWVLSVTAGLMKTLKVSIGADVVSPNNNAASKIFTVKSPIGFLRGRGLPLMTEENRPNEIVYSRVVECEIITDPTTALPTVCITFDKTSLGNSEETTATFQWSESVSDLLIGDITLSEGTKGTFTEVDGETYTLVITSPSSGSGMIGVTVRKNAVTLGNVEHSESISYS